VSAVAHIHICTIRLFTSQADIYYFYTDKAAICTITSKQTYDISRRDNLPAVDVKTWYLHAQMFDGDVAAGPVPLLFAANPDVAAASIAAEPAKAHFDLSKVFLFLLRNKLYIKDFNMSIS
jgi:hypothetical protein